MSHPPHALLAALLVGGLGCSVRPVEGDEPPDVEGLCRAHCERFMECVWTPEYAWGFSTVEDCIHGCAGDVRWDPMCEDVMEDKMLCLTSYECPEFAENWAANMDDPCFQENLAYSNCIP